MFFGQSIGAAGPAQGQMGYSGSYTAQTACPVVTFRDHVAFILTHPKDILWAKKF